MKRAGFVSHQDGHLAVHGGRGIAMCSLVLVDAQQQRLGGVFFEQHSACAVSQWECQQATQTKCERNGGRTAHHIGLAHLQDVLREQIAHGQNIAMEMQGAFGLSCGAARKGNQAHIIATGGVSIERIRMLGHAGLHTCCIIRPKPIHLL